MRHYAGNSHFALIVRPGLPPCARPGVVAAVAAACSCVLQVLNDFEAFAEPLKMYDFALTQEVQRLEDLAVVRHIDEVFVCCARFLLGCNDTKTEKADKQAAAASKNLDFIRVFRF